MKNNPTMYDQHEWTGDTCAATCKICGIKRDENHKWDKEECGGKCTVCGNLYQKGPHEKHAWVLSKERSCPEYGSCKKSFSECNWLACQTYECTVCGALSNGSRYI